MKLLITCVLCVMLFNCGPTKEAQQWIDAQNFTVNVPKHWRAIKHHGYVGYSPIPKGENYFDNLVSIFQYKNIDTSATFKTLVIKSIESMDEARKVTYSKTLFVEGTKLGDVYTHISESARYKEYSVYFQHKGNYYNYNYSALVTNYDTYFEAAKGILNSITFKP